MRQICLDTETTGRDPENGDRLVEIGCVELDGRRLTLDDRFLYHTLINPEREVPEEVVAIHNLTTERLAGEPKFAEIVDKFLDFVRGAELIIHNAEFDVGFLNMELARIGRPPIENICRITDTLAIARKKHPGQRNSLDALCARYGIDNSSRTLHGALLDSWLLAEVYFALTRGQGNLLMEASGRGSAEKLMPLPPPESLRVIRADSRELAAHEEQLDKIDKACKGTCLWRFDPNAPAPEETPAKPA